MRRKPFAVALVVAALPFAAVACGDDDSDTADTQAEQVQTQVEQARTEVEQARTDAQDAVQATTTVNMKDIEYVPRQISVKVGDTVTWRNTDTVAHTVTSESSEERFDSGVMEVGDTFKFRFTKPGTFNYVCTIHPNQKGLVTVQ